MAKTRDIKRRMKAVSNIQRITRTMQMIATARFQAALSVVTQARTYAEKISELVGELASSLGGEGQEAIAHPLLRQAGTGGSGRRLLLVITSHRGLCGGYNANVLRTATGLLREHGQEQVDVEVVGRKGTAFFRFNRIPVAVNHAQITDKPEYAVVAQLAQRYMDLFANGTYDTISVAFMAFESVGRQMPRIATLLPLTPPTAGRRTHTVDYDFEPDPQVLLNELLPMTVKVQLFQRFNEAVLAEHIARMVAMKNATDSAGKMGKELKLRFNRARQAAITTELSEIIAGAAGLD